MAIESHPLRIRLVDEMHMRRMPPLSAPLCMTQTVRLLKPDQREGERTHILAMPSVDPAALSARARDAHGETGDGIEMIWERHNEASTTTVLAPCHPESPFDTRATDALAWLEGAPGKVIRATKIAIVAEEADAEALMAALPFQTAELVSCRVGGTRIWSDFQLGPDGYGRLLVAAGDVSPADLGRTVQRIQELGNYRNLALLGLPMAQNEGPRLGDLERRLRDITGRFVDIPPGSESALLDDLCRLSAEVVATTTATGFRMSATQAYSQIAHDRLAALGSADIAGFQSLGGFTERRLLPAVRTCASFVQRLETLSIRIERATSLLRTRVDIEMQASNVELLRSMDANAARQLKLQHLVEGLSVVAVSYYAFSLLEKLFPALSDWTGLSAHAYDAILLVPVVLIVAFYLRRRMRIMT